MNKCYWANAFYIENGKKAKLYTYIYSSTIEEAKKQIEIWKNDYGFDIFFWYIEEQVENNFKIVRYKEIV